MYGLTSHRCPALLSSLFDDRPQFDQPDKVDVGILMFVRTQRRVNEKRLRKCRKG